MGFFGSFFSFFRRRSRPADIEDQLEERRLRPRVNPREETRVLVIDDSPTILTAMKRFLESAHCVFLGALDAKMGMEVALTQKPDLIFLDIVMPGINGFAALRALRKNSRTRDIPIIMMSGNEQAKAQFFGAHIGADDFMKKPFSRFEVFARIARLLDTDRIPRRPPVGAVEQPAVQLADAPAAVEMPAAVEPAVVESAAVEPVPAATEPKPSPVEEVVASQKQEIPKTAHLEVRTELSTESPATGRRSKTAKSSKAKPKKAPSTVSPELSVPVLSPDSSDTSSPPVSAQVVPITQHPAQAPANATDISPELLTRISRLAQLAQSDPEALKALAVLCSQLIAQFTATAKVPSGVSQNRASVP